MICEEFSPSPELKPYIKCFVILEDPKGLIRNRRMSIYPSGHMEMIINYGDRISLEGQEDVILNNADGYLGGQILGPAFYRSLGRLGSLSVIFQPVGVYRFFRIPQEEFTHYKIKLHHIPDMNSSELIDRVCLASNNSERLRIMNSFFRQLLTQQGLPDHRTSAATRLIENTCGNYSIRDLSHRLNINIKTLERRFRQEIGIKPKEFSRVIRFNRAFNAISSGEAGDLHDILHQCGYYDQSHFINEFKKFTGLSPSAFLDREEANVEHSFREKVRI